MSGRADELRRSLQAPHPESWRPAADGDSIVGVFVRLDQSRTARQELAWIMVLEDLDTKEQRAVWLLHHALRAKLEKAGPQIGELVGIIYEGERVPQGGGDPYKAYRVIVDRAPGATIDWAAANEAADKGTQARPVFLPAEGAGEETILPGPGDGSAGPAAVAPAGDGTRGFRCPKCLYEYPAHAAGCPEELADQERI